MIFKLVKRLYFEDYKKNTKTILFLFTADHSDIDFTLYV